MRERKAFRSIPDLAGLVGVRCAFFAFVWLVSSASLVGHEAAVPSNTPSIPSPRFSVGTGVDTCIDLIRDGSFEGGAPNVDWTAVSTPRETPICDPETCGRPGARTGDGWLWFGGLPRVMEASAEQTITSPAGTAVLSFYLTIPSEASSGNGTDSVRALVDGVEVFSALESDVVYAEDYVLVQVNLGAFANGDRHTIRFESRITGRPFLSSFWIDDVSLDACFTPPPDRRW